MDPFAHLYTQVREFLVLNGSDTPVVLRYDAEEFTIPAADKIIQADPKNPRKLTSGKDSEGNYIPGTLVLKDIIDQRGCPDDLTGNTRGRFWDAGYAIAHCLGLDPMTHETTSAVAAKGVMLLPMNPSPELVRQSKEKADTKWREFRSAWAQETARYYQDKANIHRAAGSHPGLPGKDYVEALKIIKEEEVSLETELASIGLGGANPVVDDEDDTTLEDMSTAEASQLLDELAAKSPKLAKLLRARASTRKPGRPKAQV